MKGGGKARRTRRKRRGEKKRNNSQYERRGEIAAVATDAVILNLLWIRYDPSRKFRKAVDESTSDLLVLGLTHELLDLAGCLVLPPLRVRPPVKSNPIISFNCGLFTPTGRANKQTDRQ